MDMSPGCNPLFLLLLLGAEFFQEFLSHPNSFVLRCACWGLIFGLLQHTMQHHITQPGPSERSRLLSVLNPSFHVSNTFFSQYGTELSVALGFLGGFFALFTELSDACWENGFGWILISAQTPKEMVYVLSDVSRSSVITSIMWVFFLLFWEAKCCIDAK